jgi:enamine deaminase RidA (YjgF/YER057c/UK114 family)
MQTASSLDPSPQIRPGVTLRRVCGAVADELHVVARPIDASASAADQAASAWRALERVLREEGAEPRHLVTETVFLNERAIDKEVVLRGRSRIAAESHAALTLIGQAPLEDDAVLLEIAAVAIVPRSGAVATPATGRAEIQAPASCPCPACRGGLRAHVVRVDAQSHVHAGNVYGRRESDAVTEAFDMFCEAERLLAAAGMGFGDVIRTWIQIRDIDRDYAALNQARRDFFASRGIERRPASTGVQGIPLADAHDFSLSFFAVASPDPLHVPLMSTPTLNEAWTYGADFSRGLRLVDDNKVSLIVSGTASIDERGFSVHEGDLDAQADRMLLNIETLLAEQGAGMSDLVSAVTYVKHAADAPALRRRYEQRGFGGFPLAIVEAPLCRPELLCETEAIAVLPLPHRA